MNNAMEGIVAGGAEEQNAVLQDAVDAIDQAAAANRNIANVPAGSPVDHEDKLRVIIAPAFRTAACHIVRVSCPVDHPDAPTNRLDLLKKMVSCYDDNIADEWNPADPLVSSEPVTTDCFKVEALRTSLLNISHAKNGKEWINAVVDKKTHSLDHFEEHPVASNFWKSLVFAARVSKAIDAIVDKSKQNNAIPEDLKAHVKTLTCLQDALINVFENGFNQSWLSENCRKVFLPSSPTGRALERFYNKFVSMFRTGGDEASDDPIKLNKMISSGMRLYLSEHGTEIFTSVESALLSVSALARHLAFVTLPMIMGQIMFAEESGLTVTESEEKDSPLFEVARECQTIFASQNLSRMSDILDAMLEEPPGQREVRQTLRPRLVSPKALGPNSGISIDGLDGITLETVNVTKDFAGLDAALDDSTAGLYSLPLKAFVITCLAMKEYEHKMEKLKAGIEAISLNKEDAKNRESDARQQMWIITLLETENGLYDTTPRHAFMMKAALDYRDAVNRGEFHTHAFKKYVDASRNQNVAEQTAKTAVDTFMNNRIVPFADDVERWVDGLVTATGKIAGSSAEFKAQIGRLGFDLETFLNRTLPSIRTFLKDPEIYDIADCLYQVLSTTSWLTKQYSTLLAKYTQETAVVNQEFIYGTRALTTLLAPLISCTEATSAAIKLAQENKRKPVLTYQVDFDMHFLKFSRVCSMLNQLAQSKGLNMCDPIYKVTDETPIQKMGQILAEFVNRFARGNQVVRPQLTESYTKVFFEQTRELAIRANKKIDEMQNSEEERGLSYRRVRETVESFYETEIEPQKWTIVSAIAGLAAGYAVTRVPTLKFPFVSAESNGQLPFFSPQNALMYSMAGAALDDWGSAASSGNTRLHLSLADLAAKPELSDRFIFQSSHSYFAQALSDGLKVAGFAAQLGGPVVTIGAFTATMAASYYFRRRPATGFSRSWISTAATASIFGAAAVNMWNLSTTLTQAMNLRELDMTLDANPIVPQSTYESGLDKTMLARLFAALKNAAPQIADFVKDVWSTVSSVLSAIQNFVKIIGYVPTAALGLASLVYALVPAIPLIVTFGKIYATRKSDNSKAEELIDLQFARKKELARVENNLIMERDERRLVLQNNLEIDRDRRRAGAQNQGQPQVAAPAAADPAPAAIADQNADVLIRNLEESAAKRRMVSAGTVAFLGSMIATGAIVVAQSLV